MENTLVGGVQFTFDPQTIHEIEIIRQKDGTVSVRLHCGGLNPRHDFLFPNMKHALEFYKSFWQLLTSYKEQMVEVTDIG